MVIGPKFVWAHLPKTGGTLTARVLQLFPELIDEVDWHGSPGKHRPFTAVEDQLAGRLLVMNFRRLPTWVISWYNHRARYGIHPERRPIPVDPPDEVAQNRIAQSMIAQFTADGRIVPDRWIRQEHLLDDLLGFVSELTRVSWWKRRKAARMGVVNTIDYDHETSRWLTEQQIRTLYESNPLWADMERRVYGNLLGE
jgi:hypothetical protein